MGFLPNCFGIAAAALIIRGLILIQTGEVDKRFTGWLHIGLGGLTAVLAIVIWHRQSIQRVWFADWS